MSVLRQRKNLLKCLFYLIIFTAFLIAGCTAGREGITQNPSTVTATKDIPPGDICPYEGIQVDSGIDENGNGVLDPGEVDQT